MTDDIDRILDRSLSEGFDEMRSATPLPAPRYAPARARHGTFRRRLRFGVPLILGTNMLVGVSVVTLAGASVGAKTVVTGSPNPLVWSQPVTQVSPSGSPEDHAHGRRSPEPTSTSSGGESSGDQGDRGSGSGDTSPQPSSDSSGDGGQTGGGGDGSATPTSGSDGGHDGGSSPSPSGGSDGGGGSHNG